MFLWLPAGSAGRSVAKLGGCGRVGGVASCVWCEVARLRGGCTAAAGRAATAKSSGNLEWWCTPACPPGGFARGQMRPIALSSPRAARPPTRGPPPCASDTPRARDSRPTGCRTRELAARPPGALIAGSPPRRLAAHASPCRHQASRHQASAAQVPALVSSSSSTATTATTTTSQPASQPASQPQDGGRGRPGADALDGHRHLAVEELEGGGARVAQGGARALGQQGPARALQAAGERGKRALRGAAAGAAPGAGCPAGRLAGRGAPASLRRDRIPTAGPGAGAAAAAAPPPAHAHDPAPPPAAPVPRPQDREWRETERAYADKEVALMGEERGWRGADVRQRHLDNAHLLWTRCAGWGAGAGWGWGWGLGMARCRPGRSLDARSRGCRCSPACGHSYGHTHSRTLPPLLPPHTTHHTPHTTHHTPHTTHHTPRTNTHQHTPTHTNTHHHTPTHTTTHHTTHNTHQHTPTHTTQHTQHTTHHTPPHTAAGTWSATRATWRRRPSSSRPSPRWPPS
jgi:hypothetical protein